MSTVEKSIRLYAWKTNYQTFQVVQGEANSRKFNIQLFSTTIPVDLTNCEVMFYAMKPDSTKVYVECEVIDAENGLVSVTLTDQMCIVDGTVDCWVQVIGEGGTDLRFEGMNIEVSPCPMTTSLESSDDMRAFLQQSAKLVELETEVKNARMGEESLRDKEAAQDKALTDTAAAIKAEIEVERSRINNLFLHEESSSTEITNYDLSNFSGDGSASGQVIRRGNNISVKLSSFNYISQGAIGGNGTEVHPKIKILDLPDHTYAPFSNRVDVLTQKSNIYYIENDKLYVTSDSNVVSIHGNVDIEYTILNPYQSEIEDLRVGYDGTLYPNAGEAVRGQVGALKGDLSQLSEENDALKTEIEALMVNAKSYGAKGNGATDDSPLLNDLVTKLNAEGGGTIYLPDGKYRLNSRITWKSNVSLVGESYNAVLMPYCDNSVSQGFAAISWLNTDGTQQAEYNSSNPMVNCHFRNFTIDGINQNPSVYNSYPKGINIHFLKDCTFEKIQFLNTFATGLGVDFLEDVFIHNIYCYNCGRGYVVTTDEKIVGGAGIGIGTMGMEKESCLVSDCIADGCGNYGIFLEGGDIFSENGCKSHYTIANCQCINGRNYGIAVKGTDNVVIANNIMRNNARDGFALLPRPNRCCKSIEVSNNLSKSNGECGFRFADGDSTDNISSELYVIGNVSEKNTKDGILILSVITKAFFNNNSIIENARGIAIASNDYFDVYFSGNMILNCTQNAVVKGLFKNTNLLTNQLVKLIPVHDMDYINGYVDNSGTEIENSSSKTTKSFTYCKGSQYCGFYFDSEYTRMGSENRICYCHWYDEDMNFISLYGGTANSQGWKRFTPPEGSCYVKYRIGINTGELQNSQLKGAYLMRYMTDRCETN